MLDILSERSSSVLWARSRTISIEITGKAEVWASPTMLIVDVESSSGCMLVRTRKGCGLRHLDHLLYATTLEQPNTSFPSGGMNF